jgi:hypothetical protein
MHPAGLDSRRTKSFGGRELQAAGCHGFTSGKWNNNYNFLDIMEKSLRV